MTKHLTCDNIETADITMAVLVHVSIVQDLEDDTLFREEIFDNGPIQTMLVQNLGRSLPATVHL